MGCFGVGVGEKRSPTLGGVGQKKEVGGYLLSRLFRPVPSAWRGLTALFGMGRGEHPRDRPPLEGGKAVRPSKIGYVTSLNDESNKGKRKRGQASYRVISTARLKGFHPVHLPPIDVVISHDPSSVEWKSHLEVSFALRCFQRLSHPSVATRRCIGQHNRYTSGWSSPVLSY